MRPIVFLFVMASSLMATPVLFAQGGKQVIFKITNIPTGQGKVLLSTGDGKYYGMADAAAPEIEITLDGVPDGEYTFYAFHDANGNWRIDKENGIPTEYCATKKVEINENGRIVSIALTDVAEKIRKRADEKQAGAPSGRTGTEDGNYAPLNP